MKQLLVPFIVLLVLAFSFSGQECKPGEVCPPPGPTYTPTTIGAATATPEKTLPPPGPTYTPTAVGAPTATPEKTPPGWGDRVYLPVVMNLPAGSGQAAPTPEAYP
jgi:hypothetical protein